LHETSRWGCDFCKKTYELKSSALRHEKKCFANPATKSCRTCKHAIKDSDTVYVPPRGEEKYGDADFEQSYIYCDAISGLFLMHYDKPCKFHTNCIHWELGEDLFEK